MGPGLAPSPVVLQPAPAARQPRSLSSQIYACRRADEQAESGMYGEPLAYTVASAASLLPRYSAASLLLRYFFSSPVL